MGSDFRSQRRNYIRVDPCGQKHAHWSVCHHVVLVRIAQQLTQFAGVERLAILSERFCNAVERSRIGNRPIHSDPLHMACRKHTDARPPGEWFGYMPPNMKPSKGSCVPACFYWGTICQRPRLGGKPYRTSVLRQIEGFDPVWIAGQPQLTFFIVP